MLSWDTGSLLLFLVVRHDYPNLHKWLQRLYWNHPAFKDTTDFDRTSFSSCEALSLYGYKTIRAENMLLFSDIKEHYYYSHAQINPNRIVPFGPNVNIEPLK